MTRFFFHIELALILSGIRMAIIIVCNNTVGNETLITLIIVLAHSHRNIDACLQFNTVSFSSVFTQRKFDAGRY